MPVEDAAKMVAGTIAPLDIVMLLCVMLAMLGLLLPNLFTPFVLLGLLSPSIPSAIFAGVMGFVVLSFAFLTVTFTVARVRVRPSSPAQTIGDLVAVSALGYLCALCFVGPDSAYALPALQRRVGVIPFALSSYAVWRFALRAPDPSVHLAHYMVTALLLSALTCRVLDVLEYFEAAFPIAEAQLLQASAVAGIDLSPITWSDVARLGRQLFAWLWWFLGLSWDRRARFFPYLAGPL
jgi:hypothetical protein